MSSPYKYLKFHFDIKPQPLERARKGKFGFYTPKKSADFKKQLVEQLKQQWHREPLEEPLSVRCVFRFKKPKSVKRNHMVVKPDCSNLIKGLEDAFNKILWKDDSYIVELSIFKHYGDTEGIDLYVDYTKF